MQDPSEENKKMNKECKYKSSGIITFAFATFCPLIVIVLFAVGKVPIVCLTVFMLWFISLPWVNNVKIYDDRIEVCRLFWKHAYKFDELELAFQTYGFSPKPCFIVFKKGVSWRKFITYIPLIEISDILLLKDEPSIEFLNKKIAEQKRLS